METETARPLEGARVTVDGSTRSAVTDRAGRYVITGIPVGAVTVRVRMIGYTGMGATLSVTPGQPAVANFELTRSAIALDAIVVTGTGREVEQRRLAAPVDVISAQTIEEAPVTDVAQLLQGRVAGASVVATSAQGGTSGLINFRGVTSVFGDQTPVIYVDGVRVDNDPTTAAGTGGEQSSALAELLTSDIDRIEVTKGGAASTLYGADAASGVIQIFTKRGEPGDTRVTVRVEQGFDAPELRYIFDTGLIYPTEIDGGADPDFLRNQFFQSGHFQNYYISASGGSEDLTYNMSGRIQQNDGIQPKNGSEIFSLRGSARADLNGTTTIDFSGSFTRSEFRRLYNGTAIADPLTSFEVGDVFFFTGEDNFDDALSAFISPDITEEVHRFNFSTGMRVLASDLFSARATVGLDYRTNQQRQFSPIGAVFINSGNGSLQRFQRDFLSVTGDVAATLSWPRTDVVQSDFTFGVQGFRTDLGFTNILGEDFALPGAPDFDEAARLTGNEVNTELFNGGIYVQEEIGLYDRIFLNGGVRLDINSAFGDNVDVEAFPKAGLSYIVSDEAFFQNALGAAVDQLKLRVAYGQTGKFPTPFERDRSFAATQFRSESAVEFDNPGNDSLAPEVTSTIEAGFDIALLGNRVGVGFTYYDATTKDALFFVPEQPNTGLGAQLRNVGEIANQGIELEANIQVFDTRTLAWSVGATYHTVDNEVTSLGGQAPFNIPGSGGQQRVEEGQPVGAWRVFTPYDSDGDGLLDDTELEFSGKGPTPTKSGSFNTAITFRERLTVSASADWATGHESFDWGSVWATFNSIFRRELVEFDDVNGDGVRNEDTGGNYTEPGFDFPRRYDTAGNLIGPYSQNAARSAFLMKGDWLKFRELSVRWQLPPTVTAPLGLDRATLYGSVRNLAIFAANDMIDPELNGVANTGNLQLGGQSSVTLSPPRSFRFGLEASF